MVSVPSTSAGGIVTVVSSPVAAAPSPRFSRTPPGTPRRSRLPRAHRAAPPPSPSRWSGRCPAPRRVGSRRSPPCRPARRGSRRSPTLPAAPGDGPVEAVEQAAEQPTGERHPPEPRPGGARSPERHDQRGQRQRARSDSAGEHCASGSSTRSLVGRSCRSSMASGSSDREQLDEPAIRGGVQHRVLHAGRDDLARLGMAHRAAQAWRRSWVARIAGRRWLPCRSSSHAGATSGRP